MRAKPAAFTNQHKSSQPKQPVIPKNEDKFDSPKRKETKESDSDSDSDSSDSDNSNSDSSDSDSDDSDTESDSDAEVKAKVVPPPVPTANRSFRAASMDTSARKDIKLTLAEKVQYMQYIFLKSRITITLAVHQVLDCLLIQPESHQYFKFLNCKYI